MEGFKTTLFEKKIKPILMYVGSIGAVLTAIAYVIIILTMIFGLTVDASIKDTLIFAAVNAVIGFVIMQFLKMQGIAFAKNLPHSQEVVAQWREKHPPKNKKKHRMSYFWVSSIVKDVFTRILLIVITTICVIYLVIRGSHDYTYLLLALVNLIMFACFGLISLVNAHDFYVEQHIPYLEEEINETEKRKAKEAEEAVEAEVARRMAVVQEELAKQRDSHFCADRGTHLLESCDCQCDTCNSDRYEVLDSGDELCGVLGTTDNTRVDASNSANTGLEEGLAENNTTEETKE